MRAVLLDALGTLVALQAPAPRLRSELAGRLGVEVERDDAERAIAAEIAYYRAHLNDGFDRAGLAALRARCAAIIGVELGLSGRFTAAELTDVLLASLHFDPFPDTAPALQALRADGLAVAVVSNWDVSLHDVLSRVGLAPLLDAIVTSAEAGARKPAPAPFERALALLGIAAEDAVHVGDSLEEDVVGARAAGITPVLLCRSGCTPPPGVRAIASLAELRRLT